MGTEIHPTAVVDPKAELGENVTVGPYCVIYAGVTIGDDCWLQNHVTVDGPTVIGNNNRIFAYNSIGQQTQDLKYVEEPTHLKIGDHNTFREFCTINRATAAGDHTQIGSHGNFLAYCHIGHDCIVGDHVIFSNNSTLGGHVTVSDNVILGGLTGIHQYCRIGAHVITGGCTKITKDVPPYMMIDGNPAKVRGINHVGMSRKGFSDEQIEVVKDTHKILYRQNLNTTQAIAEIESMVTPNKNSSLIVEFVKQAERGIH